VQNDKVAEILASIRPITDTLPAEFKANEKERAKRKNSMRKERPNRASVHDEDSSSDDDMPIGGNRGNSSKRPILESDSDSEEERRKSKNGKSNRKPNAEVGEGSSEEVNFKKGMF
jgi:hypothetical protein